MGHVVDALPDGLEDVGLSGYVQQTLIGFRVLYNGLRFPLTVRTTGRFVFFSRFMNSPDLRRKAVRD